MKYFLRPASHWAKGLRNVLSTENTRECGFSFALSKDGELGEASLLEGAGCGGFDALDQHGEHLCPPPVYFFGSRSQGFRVPEMATAMAVPSKLLGLMMQRELPVNPWGLVVLSSCYSGHKTGSLPRSL